jgi:HemY protein
VTPVAALTSERTEIEAGAPQLAEARLPEPAVPPAIESKAVVVEADEPAAEEADLMEATPEPVKPENLAPPVFRTRPAGESRPPAASAIIPLVRAPDDPGVPEDNFSDDLEGGHERQPGGWRGFVSRLGG